MPGPLIPALITGGASLLGSAIQAGSTANINKKTRKWNEEMYNRQRQDSLADYAMQNAYNHPSAVMQRLREAKLNPNLVYGGGDASMPSAQIKAADKGSWNPEVPQLDIGGAVSTGIGAYYDTQLKQAQVNNLQKQNDVLQQEALLKAAQTIATSMQANKTGVDTEAAKFSLDFEKDMRDISAEARRLSVEKQDADITSTVDANKRANEMQPYNIRGALETMYLQAAQRAKTEDERRYIQQQIENLKKDNELKEVELRLRRIGISPTDKWWMRMFIQGLQDPPSFKSVLQTIKDKYGIK